MRTNVATMQQPYLPLLCPVNEAVTQLASADSEGRGAIYTKREVVEFILDLAGYTSNCSLHQFRLLEPSFGNGDFLLLAIERLIESWQTQAKNLKPKISLANCIRAVELHESTYDATYVQVIDLLQNKGFSANTATVLADQWLVKGDFLLYEPAESFDFVIGNPPYVRQELIPDALITEYRRRFKTIYDRADLYIPFIEHSLQLLVENGVLGFICSDRWMKNRYGGPLRQMVSESYHLNYYVDMVDTDAFHSEVTAYPAITVITREKPGKTRIAHKPSVNQENLSLLRKDLSASKINGSQYHIKELACVTSGSEPWILESSDQLAVLRRLEASLPTLEETGCKVGIGVATGADRAFIAPFAELDVEESCKLPLATTRDIQDGNVCWQGLGIINPFDDDGQLVDLTSTPRLHKHLEKWRKLIANRYVAKKSPEKWYRTIDRIYPDLTYQEKLLIPDIKGDAHIVYEPGNLYPHHNLYYITSSHWDLRALQVVLMSGIAKLFVATYSTKMRGGYLRFQAQYIRRIRIPHWEDVPLNIRKALQIASQTGDIEMGNKAVYQLYGLNQNERSALGGDGQ